eukprot:scaffold47540_cov27-Phaeocystis_antarctica.AAC.1
MRRVDGSPSKRSTTVVITEAPEAAEAGDTPPRSSRRSLSGMAETTAGALTLTLTLTLILTLTLTLTPNHRRRRQGRGRRGGRRGRQPGRRRGEWNAPLPQRHG